MFPILHPHVTDTEREEEEEEDYSWIDDLTIEERHELIKDYATLWGEDTKKGLLVRSTR